MTKALRQRGKCDEGPSSEMEMCSSEGNVTKALRQRGKCDEGPSSEREMKRAFA